MKIQILEIGLAVLAFGLVFGLVFGAWLVRPNRAEPLGYWPCAWALLVTAGVARLGFPMQEIDFIVGVLFPTLMIAGALRYVEREVPRWLIPAALVLSLVYLALDRAGSNGIARLATLVIEPPMYLVAAYIISSATVRGRSFRFHRLLAPAMLVMLALDLFDWFSWSDGVSEIALWLFAAIPVGSLQGFAIYDRIDSAAKVSEEALAESYSLLQATLESTADGILVVGRDGKYTSYNRAFARMWNLSEAVLERGTSQDLLQPAMTQLVDAEAAYEKAQAIYSDPEMESFDTLEFRDGRIVERYSRPQRIGEKVVGRVWNFRDVTERKLAEAAMARYQNELERLVEERTRELLASRDRLRQADRLVAVGTLAAGVAHQINNPVGSILNSAEYALICEGDENEHTTWKRALEVNVEEARRCTSIVRSMLQFAREERVERRIEDLNEVIHRARRVTAGYAQERGVKFDVNLTDRVLLVEISPIEIEQVIVNLVRNAIESLETSEGHVEIESQLESGRVRVFVRDDGCGINPELLERVFDPFFSTRLKNGGTGLGLSVAHGIISDHGGEIRIESVLGQGTSAIVALPLRTESTDAPEVAEPA